MPRLAAEVVAVKACGINGLLPAAFVGGPLPFIPRFALTAPPSAARRPYNSSLENFWGEGLPINMPEDPKKAAALENGNCRPHITKTLERFFRTEEAFSF